MIVWKISDIDKTPLILQEIREIMTNFIKRNDKSYIYNPASGMVQLTTIINEDIYYSIEEYSSGGFKIYYSNDNMNDGVATFISKLKSHSKIEGHSTLLCPILYQDFQNLKSSLRDDKIDKILNL